MKHKLLYTVVVFSGILLGVMSVASIYYLSERRDSQLRRVQAQEAWARYEQGVDSCRRGNIIREHLNELAPGDPILLVNCTGVIPKPSVPRPKIEEGGGAP